MKNTIKFENNKIMNILYVDNKMMKLLEVGKINNYYDAVRTNAPIPSINPVNSLRPTPNIYQVWKEVNPTYSLFDNISLKIFNNGYIEYSEIHPGGIDTSGRIIQPLTDDNIITISLNTNINNYNKHSYKYDSINNELIELERNKKFSGEGPTQYLPPLPTPGQTTPMPFNVNDIYKIWEGNINGYDILLKLFNNGLVNYTEINNFYSGGNTVGRIMYPLTKDNIMVTLESNVQGYNKHSYKYDSINNKLIELERNTELISKGSTNYLPPLPTIKPTLPVPTLPVPTIPSVPNSSENIYNSNGWHSTSQGGTYFYIYNNKTAHYYNCYDDEEYCYYNASIDSWGDVTFIDENNFRIDYRRGNIVRNYKYNIDNTILEKETGIVFHLR
jgi:hypothetical protein